MRKIARFICACLCLCALAGGAVAAFIINESGEGGAEEQSLTVLTLWQIDSFEGGKGSRADYLRGLAEEFSKNNSVYIEVTSLSSDAARQNIENGTVPDIISYGAGYYGLESLITGGPPEAWCRGGYCLLSLTSSDFSGATAQNTVINEGRDNLTEAAALLGGLEGADTAAPTSAYVRLINGEYQFLLGTQRDVQRLITRGENFFVKPLAEFNDLYQYIAVLSKDAKKLATAEEYISYVISQSEKLSSIGMFGEGLSLYDGAMHELESAECEYGLPAVVSGGAVEKIKAAVQAQDINLVKSLLKPL